MTHVEKSVGDLLGSLFSVLERSTRKGCPPFWPLEIIVPGHSAWTCCNQSAAMRRVADKQNLRVENEKNVNP